jgi:hypothetical protein
VHKK